MKTLAAAMSASILLSGAALAQPANPPPADMMLKPLTGMIPPPPPGMGPNRRGMRMLGMNDPRDLPPPPMPPKAAEFTLRRGSLEVTVRCGDGEPVKLCADAALALMDKFSSMPDQSPDAAAPVAPSGQTPSP